MFDQFLYSLLITFDAVMVFFTFLSWGIKKVLKVLKLWLHCHLGTPTKSFGDLPWGLDPQVRPKSNPIWICLRKVDVQVFVARVLNAWVPEATRVFSFWDSLQMIYACVAPKITTWKQFCGVARLEFRCAYVCSLHTGGSESTAADTRRYCLFVAE